MFPIRLPTRLQHKLLAPFLGAMLVFALGLHLIWLPARLADVQAKFLLNQTSRLAVMKPALTGMLLSDDLVQVHTLLAQTAQDIPQWLEIRLEDAQGKRLYPLEPPAAVDKPEIMWIESALTYQAMPLGRLHVALDPTDELSAEARRIWNLERVLLAIVLVTTGFFLWLQNLLLVRPLRQLALAATRMADNDFSVALPTLREDEMGQLIGAFDAMRKQRKSTELALLEATQRSQAAQAQAESTKNLLHEAISHVALGFTVYDAQDRLVLCNEAYRTIYETSRDLLVPGATFEDIVRQGAMRGQYPAAQGRIEEWVRERVQQHQSANGEIVEQQLGDGRWLMITEFRTPSGYIAGNRVDITVLKQTVRALAESEQRWELAVSGANDGIWDWNPQTNDVFFSERWKSMLGYRGDEIGNRVDEWTSRVHPDDLEHTMEELQRHLRGETDFYQCEHRLRRKDGSYIWILDRGRALIDANGKAVRVSGSHSDVTERRAVEEREREHAGQLKAIFALSPDGFVSFDQERQVKYASPAFVQITGLSESSVVGLDEEAFSEQLGLLCKSQAPFPSVATLRATSALRSDTSPHAMDLMATKGFFELQASQRMVEVQLRLSNADTVSQILYFRDVTHQVEVDRMKSEFLSTAAHELRTPMSSIFGFSELLLSFDFAENEQREYLQIIHRQTGLMVTILNELLDLARIEARRGKDFNLADIELHELAREVIENYKTPENRLAPRQHGDARACWVRADRGKLAQAIGNVVSNAYKYSAPGGEVTIELVPASNAERDGYVGLRIVDQGIGMTPEQQERIFERFYRADASGKIPGTGLGMSIVKEIIDLHRGQIDVQSRLGTGTSVTMWIPSAQPPTTVLK
jgi:PAS domain S-box-containing protein